jgi:hypothetical protein
MIAELEDVKVFQGPNPRIQTVQVTFSATYQDDNALNKLIKLSKSKVNFTFKKYRQKRSLDANAYAWLLIGKIADVLREDKEAVYVNMLKHYGQSVIVTVANEVDVKSYFKYYETLFVGEKYTEYMVMKGSSEYDTKEMSILIDGIVQEAKELDIETETPENLERMKSLWESIA